MEKDKMEEDLTSHSREELSTKAREDQSEFFLKENQCTINGEATDANGLIESIDGDNNQAENNPCGEDDFNTKQANSVHELDANTDSGHQLTGADDAMSPPLSEDTGQEMEGNEDECAGHGEDVDREREASFDDQEEFIDNKKDFRDSPVTGDSCPFPEANLSKTAQDPYVDDESHMSAASHISEELNIDDAAEMGMEPQDPIIDDDALIGADPETPPDPTIDDAAEMGMEPQDPIIDDDALMGADPETPPDPTVDGAAEMGTDLHAPEDTLRDDAPQMGTDLHAPQDTLRDDAPQMGTDLHAPQDPICDDAPQMAPDAHDQGDKDSENSSEAHLEEGSEGNNEDSPRSPTPTTTTGPVKFDPDESDKKSDISDEDNGLSEEPPMLAIQEQTTVTEDPPVLHVQGEITLTDEPPSLSAQGDTTVADEPPFLPVQRQTSDEDVLDENMPTLISTEEPMDVSEIAEDTGLTNGQSSPESIRETVAGEPITEKGEGAEGHANETLKDDVEMKDSTASDLKDVEKKGTSDGNEDDMNVTPGSPESTKNETTTQEQTSASDDPPAEQTSASDDPPAELLKEVKQEKDDVVMIVDSPDKGDNKDAISNQENDIGLQITAVSGGVNAAASLIQKSEEEALLKSKTPERLKTPENQKSGTPEEPLSTGRLTRAAARQLSMSQSSSQSPATPPPSKPVAKAQTCIVCKKVGKCKYNIVRNGDVKHLCDDACFKRFRSSPTTFLRVPPKATTPPVATPSKPVAEAQQTYKTCSVCQLMNINTSKPFLSWQGLDYCGEECLGKFQTSLSGACAYCTVQIAANAKAKFCIKVGNDIKQFCGNACQFEFKKRLKLCAFCNKDLSKVPDSFMAPAGGQAKFRDFCSQVCLTKFEEKSNKDVEIIGVESRAKTIPKTLANSNCAVCSKYGSIKHEVKFEGKVHKLCSDPCFSAFQYANKLTMNTCDNCGVSCYNEGSQPHYVQFEGMQKRFCSNMCVNTFRTINKKIVACAWCRGKKSNFDMIERVDANNKYQLFCSLNCLSLYRVNLQATSNQAVTCDKCRKFVPAQYHLTMSDASVRNFCSYNCVMAFQAQFSSGTSKQATQNQTQTVKQVTQNQTQTQKTVKPPIRGNKGTTGAQTSAIKATLSEALGQQVNKSSSQANSIPIISSVMSLAPQQGSGQQQQPASVKSNPPLILNSRTTTGTTKVVGQSGVQQQIIIQPPPPKQVKNKSLLCKPIVQTKATSCRPHTQSKHVQTDDVQIDPEKVLIPVPVPVYIPCPMALYNMPSPYLLPIPVPIPVPIFIPTTKKSSGSILKHIKEIQERIPADPFEADLLRMAEAVATANKESDSDSDKTEDEHTPMADVSTEAAPPAESGQEDMLEMALHMANEMGDPVLDLETTIEPAPLQKAPASSPEPPLESESEEEYTPRTVRSKRGMKRGHAPRGRRSKKQRTREPETTPVEEVSSTKTTPADADKYLKFTYGVNAWKHWVLQKNAQMERMKKRGSGKLKLFKTDLLECSSDELNYTLCLFVKEVRKPNSEEYACDSIHYLCLGIQEYLYENGRIDNIFSDTYYEKFTECLHEIVGRYEPKINAAGQVVCRIEEEHLWESKQLGAHSPNVLLNTLVYFNTKYFCLHTPEDHISLSFTHIMKHWKKGIPGKSANQGRTCYLRYYCPPPQKATAAEKRKAEQQVYEQAENLNNPLRCPVKLYEFYLSKCPESIKTRNDVFYLIPERSCVPDSPVWYSTQCLLTETMNKMLTRIRLVREIQEAQFNAKPVTL